jgi:hypothetical protein
LGRAKNLRRRERTHRTSENLTRRLRCAECGRLSDENARDWTLRAGVDGELYAFCPDCDEREFDAP